ncbi:MAG: 3'-5' exonuclease domain-containing protein 2 [Bacteroidales bacterium]|nr:3'-5' exonuclease domain-containing protein 2 [Bacteroidales bacterium]
MLLTFPEITNIDKEQINEYPLRAFSGNLHIVDNSTIHNEAIKYLSSKPILGFDTETKPCFHKGNSHSVALLQLSDSENAFLFRINKIGISNDIMKIFQDQSILKVGVAIRDDLKALQKIRKFKPQGFFELQDFVKLFGIENFGLKTLAPIVLGFRISKAQQLSNWENSELTLPQLTYAATDAWVSYLLYIKLQENIHLLNQRKETKISEEAELNQINPTEEEN